VSEGGRTVARVRDSEVPKRSYGRSIHEQKCGVGDVGAHGVEDAEARSVEGQVPCSGVAVCAFGSVFSSVFEVRRLAGCGHHWRLLCGA